MTSGIHRGHYFFNTLNKIVRLKMVLLNIVEVPAAENLVPQCAVVSESSSIQ